MPNPFTTPKQKRSYRLSAAGLSALQKSARKNRPWLHSTGPKTFDGKFAIRNNNLRHGYYAKVSLPEAKEFKTFMRGMQRASCGSLHRSDPGPPVIRP